MKAVKLFGRIVIGTVIIAGLLTLLVAMLQDRFIFPSEKLDKDFVFHFDESFEEHNLSISETVTLNVLWFRPSGPSKGIVIYFHGNADNLERWGRYAGDFTKHGYEVVMMDYRGYGKSTGTPGESEMYQDADHLYAWVKARSELSRTVLYGRSLGSAVASHLAITAKPDLLILETPFDELKGAAPAAVAPLLKVFPLKSVFPNYENLRQIACKKLIFHGTNDRVVPLRSALRLKPVLKETDEFIIIQEGTHRNLNTFELYRAKLAEALK